WPSTPAGATSRRSWPTTPVVRWSCSTCCASAPTPRAATPRPATPTPPTSRTSAGTPNPAARRSSTSARAAPRSWPRKARPGTRCWSCATRAGRRSATWSPTPPTNRARTCAPARSPRPSCRRRRPGIRPDRRAGRPPR
ncbi:MAG: hypothetical protein AVDCRST_MAG54-1922, partial [uncultured Actinomycetospora sp.]